MVDIKPLSDNDPERPPEPQMPTPPPAAPTVPQPTPTTPPVVTQAVSTSPEQFRFEEPATVQPAPTTTQEQPMQTSPLAPTPTPTIAPLPTPLPQPQLQNTSFSDLESSLESDKKTPISGYIISVLSVIAAVYALYETLKKLFVDDNLSTIDLFVGGSGLFWNWASTILYVFLSLSIVFASYKLWKSSFAALAYLTGIFMIVIQSLLPLIIYIGSRLV